MTKPTAYVTRVIPQSALDHLAEAIDVSLWREDRPVPRDVLLREIAGKDGVLTMLTERVDAEFLAAAPGLKVVSNMAVGHDNVDLAATRARGVPVGYTPGVLTETTADLAFALILACARRVVESAAYVRNGEWRQWGPMILLGQDVHHATLGIVGLGRIGREVARRARGFSMRVLYTSRQRRSDDERNLGVEYRPLDALLAESDFVSLHVPLRSDTRHLIGTRELALMKPNAILVNTTRGPVVDQSALAAALQNGLIAGAGLDVTDPEPIELTDPLLALPQVTVLPHVGSATIETRTKMALLAVENLIAGVTGRPLPHQVP